MCFSIMHTVTNIVILMYRKQWLLLLLLLCNAFVFKIYDLNHAVTQYVLNTLSTNKQHLSSCCYY